jgi:hypothetical protein
LRNESLLSGNDLPPTVGGGATLPPRDGDKTLRIAFEHLNTYAKLTQQDSCQTADCLAFACQHAPTKRSKAAMTAMRQDRELISA